MMKCCIVASIKQIHTSDVIICLAPFAQCFMIDHRTSALFHTEKNNDQEVTTCRYHQIYQEVKRKASARTTRDYNRKSHKEITTPDLSSTWSLFAPEIAQLHTNMNPASIQYQNFP